VCAAAAWPGLGLLADLFLLMQVSEQQPVAKLASVLGLPHKAVM
jgi:hypothetical protein